MKNLMLLLLVALTLGCGKNNEVVTRQGVDFEFTKSTKLENGVTVVKSYAVVEVRLWNAKGRSLSYDGIADRLMAFDSISGKALAPDYVFSAVSKSFTELPAGEYFMAFVTAGNEAPQNAYSYTKFNLAAGEFFVVKKDISLMLANSYTVW